MLPKIFFLFFYFLFQINQHSGISSKFQCAEEMVDNEESYEPPLIKKKRFGDHCSAFDCKEKRFDRKSLFLSFPTNAVWKKK